MGNISCYFSFNGMVMALAIGSFISVNALPIPAYQMQIGFDDIAIGIRLGKLFNSAKTNLENCNFKKLSKDMWAIIRRG